MSSKSARNNYCNALQHTATNYMWECSLKSDLVKKSQKKSLQRTATHCNTRQHTMLESVHWRVTSSRGAWNNKERTIPGSLKLPAPWGPRKRVNEHTSRHIVTANFEEEQIGSGLSSAKKQGMERSKETGGGKRTTGGRRAILPVHMCGMPRHIYAPTDHRIMDHRFPGTVICRSSEHTYDCRGFKGALRQKHSDSLYHRPKSFAFVHVWSQVCMVSEYSICSRVMTTAKFVLNND